MIEAVPPDYRCAGHCTFEIHFCAVTLYSRENRAANSEEQCCIFYIELSFLPLLLFNSSFFLQRFTSVFPLAVVVLPHSTNQEEEWQDYICTHYFRSQGLLYWRDSCTSTPPPYPSPPPTLFPSPRPPFPLLSLHALLPPSPALHSITRPDPTTLTFVDPVGPLNPFP